MSSIRMVPLWNLFRVMQTFWFRISTDAEHAGKCLTVVRLTDCISKKKKKKKKIMKQLYDRMPSEWAPPSFTFLLKCMWLRPNNPHPLHLDITNPKPPHTTTQHHTTTSPPQHPPTPGYPSLGHFSDRNCAVFHGLRH